MPQHAGGEIEWSSQGQLARLYDVMGRGHGRTGPRMTPRCPAEEKGFFIYLPELWEKGL
jgi:hypothetical protein